MKASATDYTIYDLLDDPTMVPDRRWVEAMMLQYPAFITPAALLLERDASLDDDYRRQLTARVALLAGDRRALAMRIDQEAQHLAAMFPPPPAEADTSTENTIEGFLDRYSASDHQHEASVLERLIFNPVTPDYALQIEDDDDLAPDAPTSDQDALIAAFIDSHPGSDTPRKAEKANKVAAASAMPVENVSFSESLADDYIRHHQYAKAYDILLRLSQSDSQHSPYLDDQLAYIKKLIDLQAR